MSDPTPMFHVGNPVWLWLGEYDEIAIGDRVIAGEKCVPGVIETAEPDEESEGSWLYGVVIGTEHGGFARYDVHGDDDMFPRAFRIPALDDQYRE